MCACVILSAEDDNFPRGAGVCVCVGGGGVGLSENTLFQASLDLLGINIRSFLSCLYTERKVVYF